MKNRNQAYCFFLLITVLVFSAFRNNKTEDSLWKNKVLKYYNELNEKLAKNLDKRGVKIVYTTEITSVNGDKVRSQTTVLRNKNTMLLTNEEADVLMDNENLFVVVHRDQTVSWLEMEEANEETSVNRNTMAQMAAFQKLLLGEAQVILNYSYKKGTENFQYMELVPIKEIREYYHIEMVKIWYNKDREAVTEVINVFTNHNSIKQQKVIYNEFDFEYKNNLLGKPVRNQLLNNADQLTGKYKNYHLIRK